MTKQTKLYIGVFLFLVVNLFTAGFSELYADEAYYWMYSNFLDWGYFDHPPMIGLFIKIGYSLFQNEFGVRLVSNLSIACGLIFIFNMLENKDVKSFFLIVFSMFGLNIVGFMALPDTPLIFFTVLFFYAYKKYLSNDGVSSVLLLSVSIAALFYSKYHAVIIVAFTVLSNLALLKQKSFYIVTVLSLVFFLPNIYWQISNDFPSLQYHLVDRNATSYSFNYTLDYIGGQLAFYGPLVSLVLYVLIFVKYRFRGLFQKALFYNLAGILWFFGIMTFKGYAEVNWTIPVIVPLLILSVEGLHFYPKYKVWLTRFAYPVIVLTILLRVHIVFPFVELNEDRTNEFRGNRAFVEAVVKQSEGRPLVANRYQTASVLSFYSGELVPSLNIGSRQNQFAFWGFYDDLENDSVCFLVDHKSKGYKASVTNSFGDSLQVNFVDSLAILRGAKFQNTSYSKLPEVNEVTIAGGITSLNQISTQTEKQLFVKVFLLDEDNKRLKTIENLFAVNDKSFAFNIVLGKEEKTKAFELELMTPDLGVWSRTFIDIEDGL